MEKIRRRSAKRDKILEVVKKAKGALSAADIHKKIPDIDLVTVYRNLDVFVHDGIVKKLNLDKGEAQFEFQTENHHHAICLDCEKVIHFEADDAKLMELLRIDGFKAENLELTVRGKCRH